MKMCPNHKQKKPIQGNTIGYAKYMKQSPTNKLDMEDQ